MKYEIALFLSPKLTDEDAEKKSKDLEKDLSKFKAKILESNFLGKKDLAYPINHLEQGYYLIVKIDVEKDQIDNVRNKIRENSDVIRVLITKQEKEVIRPKRKIVKKEGDVSVEVLEKKESVLKKPKEVKKEQKSEDLDAKLDKILEEDIVD